MDKIKIAGIEMPRTRSIEIGGIVESKQAAMASGKLVQDVIGFRTELAAAWEWMPQNILSSLVSLARSGEYVKVEYPDSEGGDAAGMFQIEIGSQKVFHFRNGKPWWYNVELRATAQEVI